MPELKLLPCPFCGGVVECKQYDGADWQISCDAPECQVLCATPFHRRRDRAIAAWNNRPAPALTPELIERVLKFVGEEQLRALPTVEVKP